MLKNIYKIYIGVNLIAPIPIMIFLWAEPIHPMNFLLQLVVILWLLPILLVLFFKVRNPPMSAHMLQTNWQLRSQANLKGIVHQWVAAEDIGSKISLAAIIAEDLS